MSELPKMSKEEAKEKIRAGEQIEKVHIEDLTLSKYDLENDVQINDCIIGRLDFNKSIFHENFTMRRCKVDKLIIKEATFKKKFDVEKSKIVDGTAQKALFEGNFQAENAHLGTSFHGCVFKGEKADFGRTKFWKDATFDNAEFHGSTTFTNAVIGGNGFFKSTTWHSKATLTRMEVGQNLDFGLYKKGAKKSSFHGDIDFAGSFVQLSIILAGCSLNGYTSFADVSTGRSIVLLGGSVGENQSFRFHNANCASILLSRHLVEGHVYPERKGEYNKASKEYGFLRTVFQDTNRFDDEDWAYYQFKKCERLGQPKSYNPVKMLKRFIDYAFLDLGCGYGTKPFRTLGVSFLLIIGFALCYFLYFGQGFVSPETYVEGANFLNRMIYSFNVSLIAFSGGYGDLPSTMGGPIKILAMLEYMIGVVFMGLFVVAFSRKVIR